MSKLHRITITLSIEGDVLAAYDATRSILDEGVLQEAIIEHNRALEGKPFTLVDVDVR